MTRHAGAECGCLGRGQAGGGAAWGRTVMGRAMRVVAGCAFACAIPLVAACDPAGGEPVASASASVTAVADSGGPADDRELRTLLSGFDPVIEGFDHVEGDYQLSVRASDFYGDATTVIDPANCTAFQHATALGTDVDLTAAADDLVRVVPIYYPGGEEPPEPPYAPNLWMITRAFGDEAVAATVATNLLGSDCGAYTSTDTYADGIRILDQEVASVSSVTLPGLDEPTVRVVYSFGQASGTNEHGEIEEGDSRDGWVEYVHVSGPYAIMIEMAEMPDEDALAARLIAEFLDHMGAG